MDDTALNSDAWGVARNITNMRGPEYNKHHDPMAALPQDQARRGRMARGDEAHVIEMLPAHDGGTQATTQRRPHLWLFPLSLLPSHRRRTPSA